MTRNRGTQAPPATPRPEPINNTELVAEFRRNGGNILHVRPNRVFDSERNRVIVTKGVTIAFKKKGNRIVIASALQHTSDCFSKKIGTMLAIEHFEAGKVVSLPLRSTWPTQTLKRAITLLV